MSRRQGNRVQPRPARPAPSDAHLELPAEGPWKRWKGLHRRTDSLAILLLVLPMAHEAARDADCIQETHRLRSIRMPYSLGTMSGQKHDSRSLDRWMRQFEYEAALSSKPSAAVQSGKLASRLCVCL